MIRFRMILISFSFLVFVSCESYIVIDKDIRKEEPRPFTKINQHKLPFLFQKILLQKNQLAQ